MKELSTIHYLIFLDVDGVLNSLSFYNTVKSITENPLDPAAIKRLKTLIDRAEGGGAHTVRVILISSWRAGWNKDPKKQDAAGRILDNALALRGIRIYDKTGRNDRYDRPSEVLDYLRQYPEKVSGFVILDDANFFWGKSHLQDWWLQTDSKEDGFKEDMIEPALHMLQNPPWWLRLVNIGKK